MNTFPSPAHTLTRIETQYFPPSGCLRGDKKKGLFLTYMRRKVPFSPSCLFCVASFCGGGGRQAAASLPRADKKSELEPRGCDMEEAHNLFLTSGSGALFALLRSPSLLQKIWSPTRKAILDGGLYVWGISTVQMHSHISWVERVCVCVCVCACARVFTM